MRDFPSLPQDSLQPASRVLMNLFNQPLAGCWEKALIAPATCHNKPNTSRLITQGNDDDETIAAAFLLTGDGQLECQSVVGAPELRIVCEAGHDDGIDAMQAILTRFPQLKNARTKESRLMDWLETLQSGLPRLNL